MPVIGAPRSFANKHTFTIEIDGVEYAGFKSCSELSMEAATIEHWEGGSSISNKSPGRITVPDATLERGYVVEDSDLYDLFLRVLDLNQGVHPSSPNAQGTGRNDNDYKITFDVVQRDRDGSTLERVRLHNAWVKKYSFGDWSNDSDEKRIEQVVFAYDYPEKIPV